MKLKLALSHIYKFSNVQLLAGFVLLAILATEAIVSVMGLWLKGEVTNDYLLTGLVASLLVASIIGGLLSYILSEREVHVMANKELKQSVSLLNATLESTEDAILVVNINGRISGYNRQFVKMWSIPDEILASKDDDRAIGHALDQLTDADAFIAKVRDLYAHPEQESFDDVSFKDGRIIERYSRPQLLDNKPVGRVWSFRDVTRRKLAERELKSAKKMLQTVIDTLPARIFWKDRESRYLGANTRFAQDAGEASAAAILGKDDTQLTWRDQAELYRADDRWVMEFDNTKLAFEEPQTTPDGKRIWLRTSKVPLKNERGEIVGVLGVYDDITLQKDTERELWITQAAIDKGRVSYVRITPAGLINYINEFACEKFGYTRSELMGMPVWKFDKNLKSDEWGALWEGIRENGVLTQETKIRCKDGCTLLPVEVVASYGDYQGEEFAFVYLQDISARKQAEQALIQREGYQRALLDNFPFLVWLKDENSRFLAVNKNFSDSSGHAPDDLVGKTDLDIWPRDLAESYRADDRDVLNSRKAKSVEEYIEIGGKRNWFETYKSPIVVDGKVTGSVGFARDITERKLNEQALRNNEERLRLALVAANQGWFDINVQTGELSVSPEYARIIGYDPDDFHSSLDNWVSNVHPDDRDSVLKIFRECLETGGPRTMQYRRRNRNGEWMWISSVGKITEWDEQRRPLRMLGIHTDITERKLAENALRDSELRFRSLANRSPLAIQVFSPDGTTLRVNEAWEKMWQVPFSALERYNILQDQQLEKAGMLTILKKTFAGVSVEFPVIEYNRALTPEVSSGGGSLWVRTFAYPVQEENGQLLEVILIQEDVTARKQAEIALQNESEKNLALLHNSSDGIHILNAEGYVIEASDSFCQMLGYQRDEIIGMHVSQWDSRFSRAEIADILKLHLAQPVRQQFESRHRRKSGSVFDVEISSYPLELGGRKVLFNSSRDITARKRTEEALRESEERYRGIFDESVAAVYVFDNAKRFINSNQAGLDLLGYTRDELLCMSIPDVDTDSVVALPAHEELLTGGRLINFEHQLKRKDGTVITVLNNSRPLTDINGNIIGMLSTLIDISERKLMEEELQLAAQVYQGSSEGITVVDDQNRIIAVNPAFTEVTGYTLDEVAGEDPRILKSDRQGVDFYKEMWRQLNTTGRWQGEIWNRRKNGEVYAEWLTINTIYNVEGSVHRRVALFSDITDKKRSEELIWQQANFDALTRLPNRRMFRDRLEQDIKKSHREDMSLALLFIDLDRFKEVNDSLGHDIGDILLIEAARRIAECVRESDTVARLGGDEFTIILAELDELVSVERIAQKVIDALAKPFEIGQDKVFVSASVGITLYPGDAANIDALLKNADQAMYEAKHAGRNRFRYFTPTLQLAAQERLRLTNDMRGALAAKQFRVYYQPIVAMSDGSVSKAEALLRWQHPARGLVNPAEFISLAEESGMITAIGDWVFRQACHQVKQWRTMHRPDFQISVNKSAVQFRDDDELYKTWPDCLSELGLPGKCVVIEITESVLLNSGEETKEKLLNFRDVGIQVALDDFGTGYSSLAYLKKFDIDYLKIDRTFVHNLENDTENRVLCEAIIAMAHKLDLKVVAEGIETQEQHDLLQLMGCDYGQGYWYSSPVPAEEFEAWLDKQRKQKGK